MNVEGVLSTLCFIWKDLYDLCINFNIFAYYTQACTYIYIYISMYIGMYENILRLNLYKIKIKKS